MRWIPVTEIWTVNMRLVESLEFWRTRIVFNMASGEKKGASHAELINPPGWWASQLDTLNAEGRIDPHDIQVAPRKAVGV